MIIYKRYRFPAEIIQHAIWLDTDSISVTEILKTYSLNEEMCIALCNVTHLPS